MNAKELIETAQEQEGRGAKEIAEALGISAGRLRTIKAGGDTLKDEHAITLAEMAGLDPVLALAEIKEEQAKSPKAAAVWREMARRAQTAALLVCGLSLWSATLTMPNQGLSEAAESVYYVKSTTALGLCLFLLWIMSLGRFRARPF